MYSMIWNVLNNNKPKSLRGKIRLVSHDRYMRSAKAKGLETQTVADKFLKSWSCQAPATCNSLPEYLRKIDSFMIFKEKVTEYLLGECWG